MNVIGLIGLPGAGKTTACEALEESDFDVEIIQMKYVAKQCYDAVNENGLGGFSEEFQSKIEQDNDAEERFCVSGDFAEEIADWVDRVLEVEGDYFASRAVERAEKSTSDYCVVDGIRSTADATTFRDTADNCVFYFLHCPFETRLTRLQDRSREGEEDMNATNLLERDRQELSWGLRAILSSYTYSEHNEERTVEPDFPIEYIPAMNSSVEEFQRNIRYSFSDTISEWEYSLKNALLTKVLSLYNHLTSVWS